MSKIYKKEIVQTLPAAGELDTEYFVPFDNPEDGGLSYVWSGAAWIPLFDARHRIITRGNIIVRCDASSVSYDIALGNSNITSSCRAFVQRTTSTSVEDAPHVIGCECIAGGIRIYFNKKSTSVYYVNYIVFAN